MASYLRGREDVWRSQPTSHSPLSGGPALAEEGAALSSRYLPVGSLANLLGTVSLRVPG